MNIRSQFELGVPRFDSVRASSSALLHRKCACAGTSNHECDSCGSNTLNLKRRTTHQPGHGAVPSIVHDVLRSSGQPLESTTRSFMEQRFGHDFSRVRVHADSHAADSARAVNAHAYTVGSQIVFAQGQYAPANREGRRLIAHELAHVVQQGPVPVVGSSIEIAPSTGSAERDADRVESSIDSAPVAGLIAENKTRQLQRKPVSDDSTHEPMIEDFRRRNGFPPGGIDESGNRVGPTDSEIKYILLPAQALPLCPTIGNLEGKDNLSDPKIRQAQKDALCVTPESRAMKPACEFTQFQRKSLLAAQAEAAIRVDRAIGRIAVVPEGQRFASELAKRLFTGVPPTLNEVTQRLTDVQKLLRSTVTFEGRTCADPGCQQIATAFVSGPQLPIFICPTAFTRPSTLYRTVLHESLHVTGLDADPTTPEGYCSKFDCVTPCLDKDVADAWTHFLDCVGQPLETRRSFVDKIVQSVEEIP